MTALYQLIRIFIHVPAGIIAFTLHGYARAAASLALGDKYPANQGRLTLNPLRHIEPVGFLCFLFFRLGWSKPVETRPFAYTKDRRKSELIVAVLPLAVNLLAAAVFAVIAHVMLAGVPGDVMNARGGHRLIFDLVAAGAYYNLCFVLFNLIPVSPLDGARFIAIVKPGWWVKLLNRERMAQTILLILLFFNILGGFIGYFAGGILRFIYI
ncbi:MAG: site-2 protease family protein [Defluviitaleaceae bacterium]|nr:site-2 protease family protein [Defluviitaleaceae bacterium]MCL2835451.1 site-2 protease family protein [Defluviitaleaceae bacterium]